MFLHLCHSVLGRLGGSASGGGLPPGEGSAHTSLDADPLPGKKTQSDNMDYGKRAGGAHPTGMHYC